MPVTKLDSYYNKEEREEIIMAFTKKTWKDRITEFPTRRTLTKSDGSSELVTVARAEGTVSQEGDSFSAENMNNLETRISNEFGEINKSLSEIDIRYNAETRVPEWSPRGADTWSPFKSASKENVLMMTNFTGVPTINYSVQNTGTLSYTFLGGTDRDNSSCTLKKNNIIVKTLRIGQRNSKIETGEIEVTTGDTITITVEDANAVVSALVGSIFFKI